jgi:signal transduction histidine kinase
MESADKLPGAMAQVRRVIAKHVGQLSVLIEDLVDLANLARGTLSLQREWLDVVQEVEATVESCSWVLTRCGHTMCLEMPAVPLLGYVDGMRLRQVITHLLDNACKHTPSFGRIRLTLHETGGNAILTVEDNGAGIAPEQLPYIFDLSTGSARGSKDPRVGLGVGLALVREIVEQHGGQVEASSAGPGCGSAFVVRLPIFIPASLLRRSTS